MPNGLPLGFMKMLRMRQAPGKCSSSEHRLWNQVIRVRIPNVSPHQLCDLGEKLPFSDLLSLLVEEK